MNSLEEFYKYLKENLTGRVVNGQLQGAITRGDLERLYKEFCERME